MTLSQGSVGQPGSCALTLAVEDVVLSTAGPERILEGTDAALALTVHGLASVHGAQRLCQKPRFIKGRSTVQQGGGHRGRRGDTGPNLHS